MFFFEAYKNVLAKGLCVVNGFSFGFSQKKNYICQQSLECPAHLQHCLGYCLSLILCVMYASSRKTLNTPITHRKRALPNLHNCFLEYICVICYCLYFKIILPESDQKIIFNISGRWCYGYTVDMKIIIGLFGKRLGYKKF